MSLAPPTKVGQLQKTLHAKAKESPDYRFYALYDTLSIYPRHPAKRRPTHSSDTTRFSRRSQILRSIARRWLGDEPIVEIGLAMVPQKRKQAALAPFPEAARIRPSVLRPAQNHDRLSAYPASSYA